MMDDDEFEAWRQRRGGMNPTGLTQAQHAYNLDIARRQREAEAEALRRAIADLEARGCSPEFALECARQEATDADL